MSFLSSSVRRYFKTHLRRFQFLAKLTFPLIWDSILFIQLLLEQVVFETCVDASECRNVNSYVETDVTDVCKCLGSNVTQCAVCLSACSLLLCLRAKRFLTGRTFYNGNEHLDKFGNRGFIILCFERALRGLARAGRNKKV